MPKTNDKDILIGLCIILGFSIIIPILLNFILPLHVATVIGDETIWLAFWASFIGSIASFTVAFLTYRTLVHYRKAQVFSEKQEHYKNENIWLAELRHSISELLTCYNPSLFAEIVVKIDHGNYEDAVQIANNLISAYEKADFEVKALLNQGESPDLQLFMYSNNLMYFEEITAVNLYSLRGIAINARHAENQTVYEKSLENYVKQVGSNYRYKPLIEVFYSALNDSSDLSPGRLAFLVNDYSGHPKNKDFDIISDVKDIYSKEAERVNKLRVGVVRPGRQMVIH